MREMTATVIRYLSIAIMGGTLLAGSVGAGAALGGQRERDGVDLFGRWRHRGGLSQFSVAFLTNTGSQVSTRYAWNVNADSGLRPRTTPVGTATHTISFNATAPVGYRLTILQQRVGDMNRINDHARVCRQC